MNPKLKAVLISILFFPLAIIGNIVGKFANMAFQMFYTSIDFDFSYGEPIIIGVISGAAAAYGVGMIAKSNEYFYYLISLPVLLFIAMAIASIINGGSLSVLAANIITLLSYVYFIKTNQFK
ncbi:hypothetical protein N8804_01305 [Methylophilaceae bacterium]|nr:hypothetical protein [Methylophilaceae bacterium]